MRSTAQHELTSTAKCFRLRPYYLAVGVFGAICFSVMGIASVLAALWNIDGSFARPRQAAVVLGAGWSAFSLLSAWTIVAYFCERLFLGDTAVVQHGIFRCRVLPVEDVLQIKWRIWPARGSISVRTHLEKAKVDLDNFTRDERDQIVAFFRDSFDHELQENWSRFEESVAQLRSSRKRRSPGRIIATSAILVCFAGIYVGLWFIGLGAQNLVGSLVCVLVAVWNLLRLRSVKNDAVADEQESHG